MRYVVRTLGGYKIVPGKDRHHGTGGSTKPGLTVWVADELRGGLVMRSWRSEDMPGVHRGDRRWRMLAEARAYADQLNLEHEAAIAA